MMLFEDLKKIFNKKLYSKNKLIFVFAMVIIFSFIANSYCWFDFNFSHDSSAYIQNDYIWQIAIGRYLHRIYVFLRGELFSPFIVGALSTLWLGIGAYYLTEIFNIKKIGNILLVCGILAANSVITFITATYIFEIDVYMFSLMCSILGVYLSLKKKWIISIIFFAISLGLYQSYWQVGIIIFIFSLIKDLLLKEDYIIIIKNAFKYFFVLVFSLVVYLIGYKVFLAYYHLDAINSYNSLSNVNNLLNINLLLSLIKNSYIYYLHNTFNIHTYNATIVNFCIMIGSIFSLILIVIKDYLNKSSLIEKISIFLLVFLIPLGGNIIYIITQGMEHELMTYSFFILYIFFLVLKENVKIKYKKMNIIYNISITLICGIIIFNNVIYSNQIYMKKHTEYNLTYSILNRIIDKVEQVDGYVIGETPVLFVGKLENSDYNIRKEYYDYSSIATYPNLAVTYEGTYNSFINNVMSYSMNIVTDYNKVEEFKSRMEVKNMNCYPSVDSIKMIDGYVIIKLSS